MNYSNEYVSSLHEKNHSLMIENNHLKRKNRLLREAIENALNEGMVSEFTAQEMLKALGEKSVSYEDLSEEQKLNLAERIRTWFD